MVRSKLATLFVVSSARHPEEVQLQPEVHDAQAEHGLRHREPHVGPERHGVVGKNLRCTKCHVEICY